MDSFKKQFVIPGIETTQQLMAKIDLDTSCFLSKIECLSFGQPQLPPRVSYLEQFRAREEALLVKLKAMESKMKSTTCDQRS